MVDDSELKCASYIERVYDGVRLLDTAKTIGDQIVDLQQVDQGSAQAHASEQNIVIRRRNLTLSN